MYHGVHAEDSMFIQVFIGIAHFSILLKEIRFMSSFQALIPDGAGLVCGENIVWCIMY